MSIRREFKCPKCKHVVESWVGYKEIDTHIEKCPKCGEKMHQLYSPIGVKWNCKAWNE